MYSKIHKLYIIIIIFFIMLLLAKDNINNFIGYYPYEIKKDKIKFSSIPYQKEIDSIILQYLDDTKNELAGKASAFGFIEQELSFLQAGHPFTVYYYDINFDILTPATYVFPTLIDFEIAGFIQIPHDYDIESKIYTFGKSYSDKFSGLYDFFLNEEEKNIVVCGIENILLATNGSRTYILRDYPVIGTKNLSIEDTNEFITKIKFKAYPNFVDLFDPILIN